MEAATPTNFPCPIAWRYVQSFPFSMVSPYLAYAGWGGKIDSEGVPLFQQALVGKLSSKEFLDKFADVLAKNM